MKKNHFKSQSGSLSSRLKKSTTYQIGTIDDYIETESKLMTAAWLKQLALLRGNMAEKLRSPQAVKRLELQQQGLFLLKFLASDEVRLARDPLPGHLAEAAVAANYLLKGVDLIPDQVPEIGLADDEIIIRRVFSRNPELSQLLT